MLTLLKEHLKTENKAIHLNQKPLKFMENVLLIHQPAKEIWQGNL
jgi:hypothetical protein